MSVAGQKITPEVHQNWHLFKVWQCARNPGRTLQLWDFESILHKMPKDDTSRPLSYLWFLWPEESES